ncbi:carbohydrate esterase family 12 protein [Bipolaris maydis ATCC 48331]|uniref:Carbohydrate esterase family 12 protein n=2 Tax=Cochliobolus heterostrophus TaxID=5016 RepID=M2SV70_COCH5|nr:carbohydrate esterase family 12 protein [Bipolaris maydis ATCC 48331]EMD89260.1 carbohydrate esterase family 12 protein [Bipolaris maydis C5]KAJ5024909.1 carbohydrate esterase [Bipolaris maydis]ENI05023.1 carbohydrate esterase family 12 protein [Bipolaris maydis ATCC 48331]KAJ5057128.1 SGNH hydrolase-type esterase domain-containing protein [Bipolaris maydis]KAJ6194342.1 SGNH hydrolase-type esterase domain-containing protein [Bipolaris maydis]
MYTPTLLSSIALVATVAAAPNKELYKRAPTAYFAGDSTMANGNNVITGWGAFTSYSLTMPCVNKAIGGRSSRSYTVEGRFDEIANLVQPGDIVTMEFGHNDGGSLSSSDNGRTVCPGTGNEICNSTYNGQKVTVHTYNWYLTEAGKKFIAKGAKVIVSSQTPNNPWESGSFQYGDGGRFVGYARDVATALGANAMFVDHGKYTADMYKTLGKAGTDALFVTGDHTHTTAKGAEAVAKAFFKAVQCAGGGFFQGSIKNATNSIPGTCL